MAEALLHDDAQTVTRLDSVACLFEWMRSMPARNRKLFLGALLECSDAVQQVVVTMLEVIKDHRAEPIERQRALMTIADALFLNPDQEDGEYGQDLVGSETYAATKVPSLAREVQKMNSQESTFAQRLREQMEAKRMSQQELAERVGCSQPAISQMLNRMCRPQKKTILRLAEALNVQARQLWPDIDVAEMLDAVASFQQDDYVMTDAEASALGDTSKKNRPKIRAKSLPKRPSQDRG
jgi:transcriptional regulator with XRE-family HTH domain